MNTVKHHMKKSKVKAFTLIEMLVVLLIISVLMLLFIPNLTKQKEAVEEKGAAAVVKVVESQAQMYELNNNDSASISKMVGDEITQEQADTYNDYYAKHTDKKREVPA